MTAIGSGGSKVTQVADEPSSSKNLGEERFAKDAGRARRNVTLSGKRHPETGIPFDKEGFPDFSRVSIRNVEIELSGKRRIDAKRANEAAGLDATPEGYVWHHHQDRTTMQLVPRDIHTKTGHDGGFAGK